MDYYIRSWDPDSTYPANPQEGDVCYTITLDQSWAPVAGVKNDNLLKEEVYQNGEWVEVGGGGGGITYYVPSQNVTLDETSSAILTDVDFSGVEPNDYVAVRVSYEGDQPYLTDARIQASPTTVLSATLDDSGVVAILHMGDNYILACDGENFAEGDEFSFAVYPIY